MDNEECQKLRTQMDALDEKLRLARGAENPDPGAIEALVKEAEQVEERYAALRRDLIRRRYAGG